MRALDESSTPRELLRLLRHHPRYLPERLVVFAVEHLAEPTREWAKSHSASDSDGIKRDTVMVSRVDGAVSGTPFFIALVPAYVAFLWAQARMVMRIAALHGRDPTAPGMAAELLALRGVYPSVAEASEALERIGTGAPPARRRDRVIAWAFLVRRILVLAAFMESSDPEEKPSRVGQALALAAAGVIWLLTWVFPISFMIVMSWACESSTRSLGSLAIDYYSHTDLHSARRLERSRIRRDPGSERRRVIRTILLALSLAIPLVLIAFAVSKPFHGVGWLQLVAPLAGLSVVIALAVGLGR
jgi:hypothetical protein